MILSVTHAWKHLALLAFVGLFVLSGCTDTVLEAGGEEVDTSEAGKLRHAHLMDRAVRQAAGKSMSGQQLNLIVKLADGNIDKQRVLERYRVLERFRVLERYEYNTVFNGWAWEITDELGLGDFYDFLNQLLQDNEIAWVEPDFDITMPEANAAFGNGGQMMPWSVEAIGGAQSWARSGDGRGTVDVDLFVLDTGVAKANPSDPDDDFRLPENIDFRPGFNDARDYDGHGTHVAGIAAAADDQDRIVGVAPGAFVHNYKVLDDNGSTDVSVVIAAVEHVTAEKLRHPNRPMVVNLSLGEDIGTTNYTALDEAIEASIDCTLVLLS